MGALETFRTSDGVRLAYAVDDFTDPWKRPDTLLLLHAAMGDLHRFYAWVPSLARHFRVVRLDTRGHGASEAPGPDRALSLERLTVDVVELLDYLGCASAHVCGASAGGYLAQNLAITYPARVRRLALFSSTPGLKHSTAHLPTWVSKVKEKGVDGLLADTVRDRVDPDRVGADFVAWMLERARGMDREFTCRFLTVMAGIDLADRVKEIRARTLVVVPGADTVGTAAGYEALRRIPDHEYVVYEGLPHNITNGAPDRCAAELRRFLGVG
jgi:3-oxoadipate enol-lactonase